MMATYTSQANPVWMCFMGHAGPTATNMWLFHVTRIRQTVEHVHAIRHTRSSLSNVRIYRARVRFVVAYSPYGILSVWDIVRMGYCLYGIISAHRGCHINSVNLCTLSHIS